MTFCTEGFRVVFNRPCCCCCCRRWCSWLAIILIVFGFGVVVVLVVCCGCVGSCQNNTIQPGLRILRILGWDEQAKDVPLLWRWICLLWFRPPSEWNPQSGSVALGPAEEVQHVMAVISSDPIQSNRTDRRNFEQSQTVTRKCGPSRWRKEQNPSRERKGETERLCVVFFLYR